MFTLVFLTLFLFVPLCYFTLSHLSLLVVVDMCVKPVTSLITLLLLWPRHRLSPAGRASHIAQPAAPVAQPAAVWALQEGAARRPQQTPPPTHHQRHRPGGAKQRHGKFPWSHYSESDRNQKVPLCCGFSLLQKNLNSKSKIQKNLVKTEALTEIITPLALKSVEHHLQQVKKDLIEVVLFADRVLFNK